MEGVCRVGLSGILVNPEPASFRHGCPGYRRIRYFNTFGGSTVAAPAGTKVYLVSAVATDLATFPAVQVRTDPGSGQRFRHLATADGTPLGPWPMSGGVQG